MSGYYGGQGNSSNGQQGGGPNYNQQQNGYGQQQQQQQQQQYSSGGYGAPDNQQWQQPQYASQPQQGQQQQQPYAAQQQFGGQPQQQQAQAMSAAPQQQAFWNPATAANLAAVAGSMAGGSGFSNEAMLDLAGTSAKNFLQSGSARMIPGLESSMITLRSYYAVDNRYVLGKIKNILFPFLSKQWRRQQKDGGAIDAGPKYDLPTIDENAPDLYLPCMSLITYVLLCALGYGTAGKFDPEVIPDVTTKCIVTEILQVLIIRFGLYMMQAPVPFLDLFSYTGYKYLGLCINMSVGMLLGHFGLGSRGYYVTFLWTASAASFFMLKTMANNVPMVTVATGPKREVMVVAFAVLQFASMWFVSQTKNL